MPDGSALGRIGWLRFGSWEDDCEPSTVRSRFHFIQKGWTIQSYAAGVCVAVGAHNSTQSCGWCQGGIGLAALTSGQPPSALYLLLVLELDGKESLKACHFPTPNPFGNFLHCTCDTAIKSNSGALASCNPACPSLLVHIRSGELHRVRRCMTCRSYAVSVGRDWNACSALTRSLSPWKRILLVLGGVQVQLLTRSAQRKFWFFFLFFWAWSYKYILLYSSSNLEATTLPSLSIYYLSLNFPSLAWYILLRKYCVYIVGSCCFRCISQSQQAVPIIIS